ncbi:aminocarboxymuconate-semialdehyde decarboxylase [Microbulbifer donghaiensis]|uniref:2-amino-3-carboxymuconate-6-semialdehyde decarboxylase n=1 Tax=Microbulbifer donghaiensis TaxID=494016 RepID=A0A1M5CEM9_9GAMM|nr:amidohydrolase family protein [Microbulbifer donghaiensis]SHF53161.1 aminocarboxymuconate-semialdehyde decarboxylase [Microbulbifer donghaiensis]
MLTIDIHTHILPETWPDLKERYGYGGFIHLDHHKCGCARMMREDKFFREVESNCWDPQVRLQECDNYGVHVQVLSTVPVMFSYWAKPEHTLDLSKLLNDHIAEVVAEQPHRFVGLGTLPMQAPELAVRELERCINELGLAGVQIGSHVNGWNLCDENLEPVWAAAESLGAAIFVHPWEMMGSEQMPKYWLPWLVGMPAETSRAICSMIFGGVLQRFPKLRVAFAHGGGAFPGTIGRIEHGFEVRPDLCAVDNGHSPRSYLDKMYFDSLVHDPLMLKYLIELAGADRIALGSDYPFPLGELEPGKLIKSMTVGDDVKARLLHGTALEWLGLERSQFLQTQ